MSTNGWTELIVGISIFAPVLITIAIVVVIFRARKNDPDHERLRAQQRAYEAARREEP